MSYIVKRQKKRDRGFNFKLMNRDASDPLFHDPNVSNKVLVHAPTRSEMKQMVKDKERDLPDYLQTVNDTYDELAEIDEEKDQVDYALEQFQKDLAEAEGEGEGDYEFEDYEIDAEGDEDYEFFGFNNKVDKEFAEEVKQNYKYKPAEGIKMVEYDAYGLPKTEEFNKIKQELNLKDDEAFKEDGDTPVLFIKPPEEYKMFGYHKNVDVERKDMNQEMKEVYDMMEEVDDQVPEEDCIDDDFLQMLNDNQPALIQKTDDDYMEEYKNIDEFGELAEGEQEAMLKAREEADAMLKNMPMGLSEEMQMRLAGARQHLSQKNTTSSNTMPEEIDNELEEILDEYQDDDIGAVNDEMMDPLSDMIDQEAFDEIMQEFIETNKESCQKLYTKYHDDDYNTRIKVEGEDIQDIEDEENQKENIFKLLKQKNGEVVKLVPKEEMQRFQAKINAKEYEEIRARIKDKILQYNEACLREEAEGDWESTEVDNTAEDQEEKWDVESILSTRTNTDNHPGIIKSVVKPKKNKIKLDPKTKAPEIDIGIPNDKDSEKVAKEGPYAEEIVSESDSDEEVDVNTTELKDLETMTEKERKQYLRRMNKKQVKKEKKERRQMKKQMKKEFAKQNLKYAKLNTVGKGELKPGTSVRKL